MTTPTAYGVLTVDLREGRSAPSRLSFSNREAMRETELYIMRHRPDLKVVDVFWGYQLFLSSAAAIDTINAFHPS